MANTSNTVAVEATIHKAFITDEIRSKLTSAGLTIQTSTDTHFVVITGQTNNRDAIKFIRSYRI